MIQNTLLQGIFRLFHLHGKDRHIVYYRERNNENKMKKIEKIRR